MFTETFTATPGAGFDFTKWRTGDGFLCADSTDPVCTVSLSGGALGAGIVASDEMAYIMPEFNCVIEHCPERPDPNWRALDESIVALEDARKIVEAYVAANGEGPSNPYLYGVNLRARNSNQLASLDIHDTPGFGAIF